MRWGKIKLLKPIVEDEKYLIKIGVGL